MLTSSTLVQAVSRAGGCHDVGLVAEVDRRRLAALAAAGLPSVLHSGLLERWPEAPPPPPPRHDSTLSTVATAVTSPSAWPSVAEQWYGLVANSGAPLLMLSTVLLLPDRYRVRALPWVAGAFAVAGLGMALIARQVGVWQVPGAAFAAISYLVTFALLAAGARPPGTGATSLRNQPSSD